MATHIPERGRVAGRWRLCAANGHGADMEPRRRRKQDVCREVAVVFNLAYLNNSRKALSGKDRSCRAWPHGHRSPIGRREPSVPEPDHRAVPGSSRLNPEASSETGKMVDFP